MGTKADNKKNPNLSEDALKVAKRVGSLRDFLEFLAEHGQCIDWPDAIMPEPDVRDIAVAAGRDSMNGPAIVFNDIKGYPAIKAPPY